MAEKEKVEKYEVIVAIVNEGHSDKVMDAAREAGARGGTITHARGSGTKEIEKRYEEYLKWKESIKKKKIKWIKKW